MHSASDATASSHKPSHNYHLVDPSPWPLVGSLSAFLLALGVVIWIHAHNTIVLGLGVALLLGTMVGWWRDVLFESDTLNSHTDLVQRGLRMGMAFFIVSEVMFFVSFFWAFFDASIFPKEAIGSVWPPKDMVTLDPFHLPYLNTLLLLLSGTSITWAHHALIEDDKDGLVKGLAITVGLGAIFLCVQAYEYSEAPFSFTDGIYASTFFMSTGFHGFHVLIGTLFLLVCFFRAKGDKFSSKQHVGFEAAAWYWHFVDVVWLFLFVAVYIWGGGVHAPAH